MIPQELQGMRAAPLMRFNVKVTGDLRQEEAKRPDAAGRPC